MPTQNSRTSANHHSPIFIPKSATNGIRYLRNHHNLLLNSLTADEYARLRAFMKVVQLDLGRVLVVPDEPIRHIYFPIDMVGSTIQELSEGSSVEIGLMGREGLVGVHFWLGQRTTPTRTLVQVPGTAYSMSTESFRSEVIEKNSPLNQLIAAYIHAFLMMTGQTAACNRLHEVETRLARWLSLVYDRTSRTTFPMRQEFLAAMLGVQRPSVSIAANALQRAGLIAYRRGELSIQNPAALRLAACECYTITEAQFDKMFGSDWRTHDSRSDLRIAH